MRIFHRTGFPIPRNSAAITIGTWIFIRPGTNVLPHEKIHVRQFMAQPFTFWLRYLFSKKWRLRYEAEAYATSVKNGASINMVADALALDYKLNITLSAARNAISKYL